MNPLLKKTFKAGAAIAARRIVKFGADDEHVIQGAASSDCLIGVMPRFAAAVAEDRVDITIAGIKEVELGGSVTRGDRLTSDSVGRGVAATGGNSYVGVAFASGVSGDIVPCLVCPGTMLNDGPTYIAIGTIAAAQVRTLNATPQTLVAAPGSNKALVLVHATLWLDYESAGYDSVGASDDLTIRYTNASGATLATIETTGFMDQTADQVRYVYPTTTAAFTPASNAPLVLHCSTGEMYSAAGDSPLKYKVHYRVIDTSW